jgi:hypothetical protein
MLNKKFRVDFELLTFYVFFAKFLVGRKNNFESKIKNVKLEKNEVS